VCTCLERGQSEGKGGVWYGSSNEPVEITLGKEPGAVVPGESMAERRKLGVEAVDIGAAVRLQGPRISRVRVAEKRAKKKGKEKPTARADPE